jgi:hypothetical protein
MDGAVLVEAHPNPNNQVMAALPKREGAGRADLIRTQSQLKQAAGDLRRRSYRRCFLRFGVRGEVPT